MSKSVIVAMVGILVAMTIGAAYAANTLTKKAGEYTVGLTLEKSPPVMGKNNVDVSVKDAKGAAVTDASVVVEYSMPAMSGMPAMNYKTNAELKGDTYKAVIEPSMSGSWNLAVKISRGGKTETAKYTMDVK
jgi:nitrogen fixation protein FixH